jgi:hypothetical protein
MEAILRAGVRAEFEQIALETRAELKLVALDPFDPTRLAEHFAIDTVPIDVFRSRHPEAVRQLVEVEPTVFSAATVFFGSKRTIVYNPQHSPRRHANTMAHELAHVLLEHEPAPLFDAAWKRHWCPVNEQEADYLAGALLVPRSAVAPIMELVGDSVGDAARHFGISANLMYARIEAAEQARPMAQAELAALLSGGEAPPVELRKRISIRRTRESPSDVARAPSPPT